MIRRATLGLLVAGCVACGSGQTVTPLWGPKPPGPPIFIGYGAEGGELVHHVSPNYPPEAKAKRVSGMVEFRVTVGTDGSVRDVVLVRGNPSLVGAAKTAVLQWRYRPLSLNGTPVAFKTNIVVNFTLNQ